MAPISLIATCLLAATSIQPDSAPPESSDSGSGFSLALRLGYGLPMGKVYPSQTASGYTVPAIEMSDLAARTVPIGLDITYRFSKHVQFGLYLEGAPGVSFSSALGCGSGIDCTAIVGRIGLEGIYHFTPESILSPWVGVGTGIEAVYGRVEVNGTSTDYGTGGWEMFNIQAGLDYNAASFFSIGPFASFSLTRYISIDDALTGLNIDNVGLSETALHEWIRFGLKGTFNL